MFSFFVQANFFIKQQIINHVKIRNERASKQMLILIIFISGIVGTVLMSLFNHLMSIIRKRPFMPPHLLNQLMRRKKGIPSSIKEKSYPGWVIHFAIGVVFAFFYYFAKLLLDFHPGFISGLVAGFIFGLIGILGWYLMFKTHADPPDIHLRKYLIHLLAAHVVFGFGVALVYGY